MAERELRVKITGESRDAEAALRRTKDATEKLSPASKIASTAVTDLSSNFTSKLGPAAGYADDVVGKFTSGLGTMSAGTMGAVGGVAVAGAALAAFAAKGVGEFTELAGSVKKFRDISGATAEESSRWIAVMDDYGIAADTGASAMGKLAKGAEMNEGKLRALGVEIERNADGTLNLSETMLNVSDAYSSTNDSGKRAAITMAAFGKSGQALVPILQQGRTAIEEMFAETPEGQILSDEDIDKAEEFRLAMDELSDAVNDFARGAGGDIIPILSDMASGVAGIVEVVDEVTDKIGGFGTIARAGFAVLSYGMSENLIRAGQMKDKYDELTGAAGDNADASDDMAESTEGIAAAFEEGKAELEAATERMEEHRKALEGIYTASQNIIAADVAMASARDKAQEAMEKATEAQQELHDVTKQHGAASAEAKAATEGLDDANRNAIESVGSLAAAEVKAAEQAEALAGRTLTAAEKNEMFRESVERQAQALAPGSPIRGHLEALIGQMARAGQGHKVNVDTAEAVAKLSPGSAIRAALGNTNTALHGLTAARTIHVEHEQAVARIGQVGRMIAAIPRNVTVNVGANIAAGVPGRASGGAVHPAQAYVVGEQGPELFQPSTTGRVIPAGPTATALGRSTGESVTVDVGTMAAALRSVLVGLAVYLDGERVGQISDARLGARVDMLTRGG